MSKKLSIYTYNDTLYVKFINMIHKAEFNNLVERFKQEFCDAKWDWKRQYWKLALTDAPRLNWFVHRYFGYDAIVYENPVEQENTA